MTLTWPEIDCLAGSGANLNARDWEQIVVVEQYGFQIG